jgi:hypothetical protein
MESTNPYIAQARERHDDIEKLLEDITVDAPGMWENDQGPEGYHAVTDPDNSVIAYFAFEADAYRFRLDLINRILNP